jgi:hypothetical protein
MRVQLWMVDESPVRRFVTLKHLAKILQMNSGHQVKTSGSRLRRLSLERFVVWKSAIM